MFAWLQSLLESTSTWTLLYIASEWVIRLVMLVVIPARRTPDTARGWLIVVFFLPWPGLILYLLIAKPRWPKRRRRQFAKFPQAFAAVVRRLAQQPEIYQPEVGSEVEDAVRMAQNLGDLSVVGGNAAELLFDYDGIFARLADDIDAARNHVHLLFYIFDLDATSEPVAAALERAARRGVKCRVLVDAFGSGPYLKKLRERFLPQGIALRDVLPLGLFRRNRQRFDLRNHRKLVVIDGTLGYTGSLNMIRPDFKRGLVYRDMLVRVSGPVVPQLQYVFTGDWFLETEELLDEPRYFPVPEVQGSLPAQVLPGGPNYASENHHRLIVALLHGARKRVVLTTPYFIPDQPLLQALQTAVLRGVEVTLITSQAIDQWLVGLAQQSYYEELLEAGVRIFLHKSHFLHEKHATIDDLITLIGSSNMDVRSFSLNAEINILFYNRLLAARLRAHNALCEAECEQLTLKLWQRRPRWQKYLQNIARQFSPLL